MLNKLLKHHPMFVYAQEIADICRPLQKLNIGYFSHVKITNDKKIAAVSSNPSFSEHYLKNKYYSSDIHMIDANKFGNYFLWDGAEFSRQSAEICQVAGEFGIHKPLSIIQKNKHSTDYYHFGGLHPGSQNNMIYLANLDLLNLFIKHFNENIQQSKALNKSYKMTFTAAPENSIEPVAFKDTYALSNRNEFTHSLQLNTPFRQIEIENIRLSKRQSEILKYIVQGKTYKEISKIVHLSPRTIGHYFEAVKNKLAVSTRSDVIAKIIASELITML